MARYDLDHTQPDLDCFHQKNSVQCMIWTILHHLRKRRQLDQSDQLEHAAEHGHHSP